MTNAPSSNGKTADFESANRGSNPRGASRFVRMLPTPELVDALGAVLSNLDEVLMTDCERAEALVWAWEGMRAQGIETQRAKTEGLGPKDESPVA